MDAGTHPDLFQVAKPEDKNEFPAELMKELVEETVAKLLAGKGRKLWSD